MIEKDTGFILKRIDFRETSIITTLFTRKYGKITGILKGFYSSKKEFTSSMDMYTLNQIIFYPKKTDIWLVSFTDLVKDFAYLRKDYEKNSVAAKCIEVINSIVPFWENNEKIFYLLYLVLSHLENTDAGKMLYVFFIKFLSLCGLKPELKTCLCCNTVLEKELFFSYSQGGLVCKNCRGTCRDAYALSPEAASTIYYIQHNEFPYILRINPTVKCKEQIFNLLDRFLAYHLHFKLFDRVLV